MYRVESLQFAFTHTWLKRDHHTFFRAQRAAETLSFFTSTVAPTRDVSNTFFDDFSDPSREEIDWIHHEAGVELTPQEVNQRVRALRQAGTRLVDTVPPGLPALESRCDL